MKVIHAVATTISVKDIKGSEHFVVGRKYLETPVFMVYSMGWTFVPLNCKTRPFPSWCEIPLAIEQLQKRGYEVEAFNSLKEAKNWARIDS